MNKGSIDAAIKDALRFSVYSTQYANAFNGYYPLSTLESINKFEEDFKEFGPSKKIKQIFQWKNQKETINDKELVYATCLDFLEKLDEYLFNKYEVKQ